MKLCPFALTLFVAAFSLSLSACGGSNATTTPPPTYYTIGGTVSGLSGLGLALQDNETDNMDGDGIAQLWEQYRRGISVGWHGF